MSLTIHFRNEKFSFENLQIIATALIQLCYGEWQASVKALNKDTKKRTEPVSFPKFLFSLLHTVFKCKFLIIFCLYVWYKATQNYTGSIILSHIELLFI